MKKHITWALISILLVFALSGCKAKGNQSKSQPTIQEPNQSGTPKTIDSTEGTAQPSNTAPDNNNSGKIEIPAQMTDACNGKSEQNDCQVVMPGQTEKTSGKCVKAPEGEELICLPLPPAAPDTNTNQK